MIRRSFIIAASVAAALLVGGLSSSVRATGVVEAGERGEVSAPEASASTSPVAMPPVPAAGVRVSPVGLGYARNSVNVAVFRKQSVVTHERTQFTAFYDADGAVVLAKRSLGSDAWTVVRTELRGSTTDAHNAINLGVDGDGHLHVAWDHHNSPLNYRRSASPMSLDLVPAKMTGDDEDKVTYPEFHQMPDGGLMFLYRDGSSGRGNLAMKRYDLKSRTWKHVTSSLVDGENRRNAYWQACTDGAGTIHLSWVWRSSPDVATNHDIAYARSTDGGQTWTDTKGRVYALPITAGNAEYAVRVSQRRELINQTSMTADAQGRPFIATYWRPEGSEVPQYQVVYHDAGAWHVSQVGELKQAFRLGGGGTKRIPISRPQILSDERGGHLRGLLVFRAEELGGRVMLATCPDLSKGQWTIRELTTTSVGQWEPSFDPVVWRRDGKLHLFVQKAEQVDGEGVGKLAPQPAVILEVEP